MIFSKVKFIFLFLLLLSSKNLLAQNTGISDVANTPNPSAVLDVFSTSKGMLVPRLLEAQRTAISTPATGLLVYQTDGTTPGFYYYTGTTWTPIASGSGSRWSLVPNTNNIYYSSGFVGVGVTAPTQRLDVTGNFKLTGAFMPNGNAGTAGQVLQSAGVNTSPVWTDLSTATSSLNWALGGNILPADPGIRNLGTISNHDLPFITNNTEKMRLSTAGYLGLGTSAPSRKFHMVSSGSTGGIEDDVLYDTYTGTGAGTTSVYYRHSRGTVATPANLVSEDVLFDMVGVGYINGSFTNSSFLRSYYAGNGTNNLSYLTLGTSNAEQMRITSTGNVGIGLTAPTEKLEINGNMRITGPNAGTRRLVFASSTLAGGGGDPDGVIELRPVGTNEQQEMLFYMGNDNTTTYGPDRIRMVAEEIRFQNFNNDTNTGSSLANAETQTNVNTRLIITPVGNVGINMAAPAERIDVAGNFKLTGAFMPNGNAGTAGQVLQSAGVNTSPVWVNAGASSNWALGGNNVTALNTLGTTSAFDLPFITNNIERMRILSGGNVGIGTAAPLTPLHVSSGTSGSLMYLQSRVGGAGSTVGINFKTYSDVNGNTRPTAQINAIDDGVYSNHITFSTKVPGVETNALAERMRISSSGNVGIGTATFDEDSPEQLLVEAQPNTYNAIVARGNINNYFQTNIQNLSTGNQASSDVVATANNGTETTNFIDMGINNSNYVYQNGNAIETGKANDGYILSAGQDFYIVNNNPTKDMIFNVGGTATSNEAMRITSAGERVGIANNAPNSTLSVGGSLSMAVKTVTANYTLTALDYVVINTGATATWTLPPVAANKGRIYRLLNHGTGAITLSQSFTYGNGATTQTINTSSGQNAMEIISDGTVWRKINY